jgi:ankyrin repeat protein
MNSKLSLMSALACAVVAQACSPSSQTGTTDSSPFPPGSSAQSVLQSLRPGDLVRSVANGDETKVRQLLQSGADVNERLLVSVSPHGKVAAHQEAITPLLAAIAMNYENIASLLINYQAKSPSAFQPTFQGYTAKDFLLYRGQNSTASLLR